MQRARQLDLGRRLAAGDGRRLGEVGPVRVGAQGLARELVTSAWDSLDEFPILKDALTAALEVPAPVLPKRKATTAQVLCNGIRSAFEAWDGIRADERPEWPTSDEPALQTEIDKIAAAFDTQDDGSEQYTTDKVDFAMTWGLALLDAESGQIAA